MSLIAEALRKSTTASGGPSATPPAPRSLWIYRGLLIASVSVILVVLSNGRSQQLELTRSPSQDPAPSPPPPALVHPDQTSAGRNLLRIAHRQWSLNGIVRGGGGKPLALINNELVAEGETFQGAQVVQVAPNRVDLLVENHLRTLTLEDEGHHPPPVGQVSTFPTEVRRAVRKRLRNP